MPKDNNQQPTTLPPTTNGDDQSPIFVEETLPPMPQEEKPLNQIEQPIDNKPETQSNETPTPTMDSGSASPQDENIMPPIVNTNNKKRFVGGKVIATILGLFLLIGGVGAGIFLVDQNQNINEKAVGCSPEGEYCGDATTCCNNLTCTNSICVSTPTCSHNACMSIGGSCCTGFTGVKDLSCGSQIRCNPSPTEPPSECISNGRCLDPGEDCCGNDSYTDNSCTPTTTRCGTKPTTAPTAKPVNECETAGGTCKKSTICSTGENKLSLTCEPGSNDICCKSTVDPLCATQIKCNVGDTTCSVGSLFSSTCYVNHYICDKEQDTCNTLATNGSGLQSASLTTTCGTEQIDLYCVKCNLTGNLQKYTYRRNPSCGPTTQPTTPPTGNPGTASCTNIKAYTEDWVFIPQTNLSKLKAGNKTNFCVTGTTGSGSFDKARVTINGVLKPETKEKRPSTNDFCYLYTIPSGTKTFNITSQIHHVTLDWK